MSISNVDSRKFDAIVCLSAIDWDFLWQRTQEVMSQFAAMGYPVLFVENTGVRAPGFKDVPRVLKRAQKLLNPKPNQPQKMSAVGVKVLSPFSVPFPYSTLAVKWNSLNLRKEILLFSKQHNIPLKRILLWSYMTTPLAVELAEKIPWVGVVVDLVSDPCKVKGAEQLVTSHRQMLKSADVVLCASVPTLNTAKHYLEDKQYNKLHLFEDGFSVHLYETAQNEFDELKVQVNNPNAPIVAYIGGVNNKIWWDAVSAMAEGMPEVNFVFVGPKEYEVLPCEGLVRNVYWLPPFEKYWQLGAFLKKCKAGLIPYTPTPYVSEMRPAKINEYLVMGLPIVATKMPELERLGSEHGQGIVYLADSARDFTVALRRALEEDCEEYLDNRNSLACSRSWDRICKELEESIHLMI